jgi:SAM-dependent methyltransferase
MDPAHERELERIRSAYARRDAGARPETSAWEDPAYVLHMQGLERGVLRGMRRAGTTLSGADVLEVGCGSGVILHRLVELGAASGTGVELMENRVQAAHARYPTLDVRQGDAGALPFEDGRFDVVTQFTCLSSVLDPGLRARIAAEMWRVLRPGGVALSYDMRPSPTPVRAARALLARTGRLGEDADATPIVQIGAEELRRLFGVAPASCEPISLNPALFGVPRRSPVLGVALGMLPALRSHLLAVFRKPSG